MSASGAAATETGTELPISPSRPSALPEPDGAEQALNSKKAAEAAQIVTGMALPIRRKFHS